MGLFNNLFNFTNMTSVNTPAAPASISYGTNAFASFGSLPLIGIAVAAILIMLSCIILLADWERFKQMKNIFGWLIRTFDYFLYGFMTLIIIGIPIALIWFGGSTVEANPQILLWIGGIIGGFFIISGIGYVFKPFYNKINKNIERSKKQTETIPTGAK